MASVNKVILIGNLGRDPELRYTASGQGVANFTLATNERWRDKDGNNQERTEWHRIVVWGKTAENCAQYLQKGRSAYVEGRLQTREWEDRDGNKRRTTEVTAQQLLMLGRRGDAPSGGGPETDDAPSGDGPETEGPPESGPKEGGPDDIPF